MSYPAPTPACFFDPAHGFATAMESWQPPRGVTRPIPVCPGCQQALTVEAGQHSPSQHAPRSYRGDDGPDVGEAVLGAAGVLAGGMVLGSMLSEGEPSGAEDDDWF